MEAFLVSAGLVAIAEIGDKTQLLAMILAARYHKPIPIILGIQPPRSRSPPASPIQSTISKSTPAAH